MIAALAAAPVSSDLPLLVRRDGDRLRVSAPQVHFLTGDPLRQLKNGATVAFLAQVTLTGELQTQVLARIFERFVLSYDIWEEKFSAVRTGATRRAASRMNVPATEAWCLDYFFTPPAALAPERPFWLRLELRGEEPRETAAIIGEPGINLTRLVELFGRPAGNQQPQWTAKAGPLRLSDLP